MIVYHEIHGMTAGLNHSGITTVLRLLSWPICKLHSHNTDLRFPSSIHLAVEYEDIRTYQLISSMPAVKLVSEFRRNYALDVRLRAGFISQLSWKTAVFVMCIPEGRYFWDTVHQVSHRLWDRSQWSTDYLIWLPWQYGPSEWTNVGLLYVTHSTLCHICLASTVFQVSKIKFSCWKTERLVGVSKTPRLSGLYESPVSGTMDSTLWRLEILCFIGIDTYKVLLANLIPRQRG